MSGAWECRPYRRGDEPGILDLYRAVFRLDLTPEYWRWAFENSPDGPAVIAVIEQDHQIVGHYEVTPKRFWVDGIQTNSGYAGGTMLAPQIRNVSSFVELAKMAYELCRERQVSWLYCCPNEAALPVRTRLLQWRQLSDITEWEGGLPEPGADDAVVHTWDRWPDALVLADLPPTGGDSQIRSTRSAAWVQWRYFARPGSQYVLHTLDDGRESAGFAITKRYHREGVEYGHIIDWHLLRSSDAQATGLLNSVWRQLRNWNVQRVSCWADGNAQWQAALSHAGLTPTGRKTHLCYYDLAGAASRPLAERDAWQVVMADCDVY